VKLHAKTQRGHPETQQRALKGNVTTFDLNMDKIGHMLSGGLMPQLPEVLCSVLSVCYVGSQPLSQESLHSTFRVRRQAVADTLLWLKSNNTKYYGDITLDLSHLERLPADGVPDEILATIRQDGIAEHADMEEEGYVPHDDVLGEFSIGTLYYYAYFLGARNTDDQRDNQSEDVDADVIPLNFVGMLDTETTEVSVHDLTSEALHNSCRACCLSRLHLH